MSAYGEYQVAHFPELLKLLQRACWKTTDAGLSTSANRKRLQTVLWVHSEGRPLPELKMKQVRSFVNDLEILHRVISRGE